MVEAYLKMLSNYAVFTGRSRRRDYWLATLMNLIIIVVLLLLSSLLSIFMILYYLYALAILVPGIALSIRRLHDTGRSGWWFLIVFVPFVGSIALLVFMCMDSVDDNEYGPNPKAAGMTTIEM